MTELAWHFLAAAEAATATRPSFHPRIAAAQALLESGDPPSRLAVQYGNCLGIKAGTSWTGPTVNLRTGEETPAGDPYSIDAAFRVYQDWVECFRDYAAIIAGLPWYQDALAARNDPVAFLLGLITPAEPSYATDTRYVEKVLRVAYAHGLLPEREDEPVQRLGRHELVVDNAPTLGKALEVAKAALSGRPAAYRAPHLVTRSRRPDLTYKLDVDLVE